MGGDEETNACVQFSQHAMPLTNGLVALDVEVVADVGITCTSGKKAHDNMYTYNDRTRAATLTTEKAHHEHGVVGAHAHAQDKFSFPRGTNGTNVNVVEEENIDADHDLEEGKRSGRVFGSAANLTAVTVGPGILSLPAAFAMVGWLTGSILLVMGAVGACVGLHLLSKIAHRMGGTKTSYGSAGATAGPLYAILSDVAVGLSLLMAGGAYMLVLADLLPLTVQSINPDLAYDSILFSRRFWITVVMWGVGVPLCLLPSTSALRFTSMASMCCLAYVAILSILYFINPPTLSALNPCAGLAPYQMCKGGFYAVVPGFSFFSFIRTLSTFFFAFNCHPLIFNIYNEIRTPSVGSMDGVVSIWGCFVTTLYALFGLCGYFTFGDNVRTNIITNWPPTAPATVGRLALCFSLTASFPLIMQATRTVLTHLANESFKISGKNQWVQSTHRVQKFMFWGTCAFFVVFSYLLAFFVTDLGLVLSLIGATGSAAGCYIIPGFIYWKLYKDDGKEREVALADTCLLYVALGMAVFGVVYVPVGVASVFLN